MRTWKSLKQFKKQSGTTNAIIYHGYYSTRNASLFNNRRRRLLVEEKMKEYKVTVTITREYLIGAEVAEDIAETRRNMIMEGVADIEGLLMEAGFSEEAMDVDENMEVTEAIQEAEWNY